MDGHNRKNLLKHHKVWLKTERDLELQQYVWVKMSLTEVRKMYSDDFGSIGDVKDKNLFGKILCEEKDCELRPSLEGIVENDGSVPDDVLCTSKPPV